MSLLTFWFLGSGGWFALTLPEADEGAVTMIMLWALWSAALVSSLPNSRE